jgi:hypothetical protein
VHLSITKLVLVIHESVFWKCMYFVNWLTNCFSRVYSDGVVHMRQSTLFREFGVLSIRVDFGWISTNFE